MKKFLVMAALVNLGQSCSKSPPATSLAQPEFYELLSQAEDLDDPSEIQCGACDEENIIYLEEEQLDKVGLSLRLTSDTRLDDVESSFRLTDPVTLTGTTYRIIEEAGAKYAEFVFEGVKECGQKVYSVVRQKIPVTWMDQAGNIMSRGVRKILSLATEMETSLASGTHPVLKWGCRLGVVTVVLLLFEGAAWAGSEIPQEILVNVAKKLKSGNDRWDQSVLYMAENPKTLSLEEHASCEACFEASKPGPITIQGINEVCTQDFATDYCTRYRSALTLRLETCGSKPGGFATVAHANFNPWGDNPLNADLNIVCSQR